MKQNAMNFVNIFKILQANMYDQSVDLMKSTNHEPRGVQTPPQTSAPPQKLTVSLKVIIHKAAVK